MTESEASIERIEKLANYLIERTKVIEEYLVSLSERISETEKPRKKEPDPPPIPMNMRPWSCLWSTDPTLRRGHSKTKANDPRWLGKICTECEARENGNFPMVGQDKAAGE